MNTDLALASFVHALPKTETHLHVEGALPYELLHAWEPTKYPPAPDFRSLTYRYESFPKFDEILLGHALPWFTTAERYYEAARVIFAKHVVDHVRYVETSFHLPVTQFIRVPGPEIIAAIRAAVPPGLEVRIFAGMLRTDYTGPMRAVIDDIEHWEGLAGVDLHGFEIVPTEAWAAPVWARLRRAGKITKCHAGEFDGAGRVREAIEVLGVSRVQHGVRAIEDPAVVRLAAERGVTFDVCPISNVRLQVVPSLAQHPLRQLMKAGINCTISTDDPLVFANRVSDEYLALATEAGFTAAELGELAKNGWRVADVPAATRTRMMAEIDRQVAVRQVDARRVKEPKTA
ncbi:MAG TPA: adenosine deaminase [Candidatus Synoicihabitans sp.]|nr:adenosine deaminase [Candidatus Synoicihabitans sp.]